MVQFVKKRRPTPALPCWVSGIVWGVLLACDAGAQTEPSRRSEDAPAPAGTLPVSATAAVTQAPWQRDPAKLDPAKLAPAELAALLRPLCQSHRGKISLAVKNLKTQESFEFQADQVMPTASLIKVAVMLAAYQQAEGAAELLSRRVTFQSSDHVPGSGILASQFSPGASFSLRDAIRLMIAYSDNVATNLVLDVVPLEEVNRVALSYGLRHTRINAKVFRGETSIAPEQSRRFGLGSTTAGDMIRFYELLYRGELVTAQASQQMREHLKQCDDTSKLARNLPPRYPFAHKTGAVTRARCDAGVVETAAGPIAICVLTAENEDTSWSSDNQAERLCGQIGEAVLGYFTSSEAESTRQAPRTLASGATGRYVEYLQRTLNARLNPSPGLAIDGDFGPRTEAAVRSFQEKSKLEISGIVAAETWHALGPLVTEDSPLPPAAELNAMQLPVKPQDPLTGPPAVTAKAWALLDLGSDSLIGSANADTRLPIASTTKVATAAVILDYLQAHPELATTRITFSATADATPGSSCRLETGESVPLDALLYGLLLPSGNDAATALAEHFGHSIRDWQQSRQPAASKSGQSDHTAPDHTDPDHTNSNKPELSQKEASVPEPDTSSRASQSSAAFVEAMNHWSRARGLRQTHFANPHGLPDESHRSTAADLAKLTQLALQTPRLRTIVNTRQYATEVVSLAGYRRTVLWKNTNRLLDTAGYSGVKTGTTRAAGACLIALAERDDRELLLVLLGSTSSDARYVDARNLLRWGLQQSLAVQSTEED